MIATKDQERTALAKIKKTIESLGEDSYIGMALSGALGLAALNIENDAGFSCQDYMDKCHLYEEIMEDGRRKRDELHARVRALETEKEDLAERLWNAEHAREADMLRVNETEARITALADNHKLEIMRLKAQLYDLMTG